MFEAVLVKPWPWWLAGPAIGLIVTLLAWIGGKSLGVSSGYGAVCATVSHLSFFRTRDYTERWRLAFVVGMPHLPHASRDPPAGSGLLPDLRHGAGADPDDGRRKPRPRAGRHDAAILGRLAGARSPGVFGLEALELNPLVAGASGAAAVDARATLGRLAA